MEKILINKYGDAIAFNVDTNSISKKLDNIDCYIYKVTDDGQVITDWEVVDVKKDDIVLVASYWTNNSNKVKVAVISDPVAMSDLNDWYDDKLKDQSNNEAV